MPQYQTPGGDGGDLRVAPMVWVDDITDPGLDTTDLFAGLLFYNKGGPAPVGWYIWNGAFFEFVLTDVTGAPLVHLHVKADISDLETISETPVPHGVPKADAEEDPKISTAWLPTTNAGGLGGEDKLAITDEAGYLQGGIISPNGIANTRLAFMANLTIKGNVAGGDAQPADMPQADVRTVIGAQTTPAASKIPVADGSGNIAIGWLADGSVSTAKIADDAINAAKIAHSGASFRPGILVYEGLNGEPSVIAFKQKRELICVDDNAAPVAAQFGGTSFPTTNLIDGRRFWREDHNTDYRRVTSISAWLSVDIIEIPFEFPVDANATQYLAWFGTTAFTDTFGEIFDFDVKVVGISMCMQTSGTATVQVFDDGTGVTGATLALSAQKSKADSTLLSSTIAAGSLIGVKVTSGTVEGAGKGVVRLRRVAT